MLPRATAIALIVLLVPVLVYCVFALIAGWKTMRKMHRPGWFIFIPYAPTIVSRFFLWKNFP